MDLPIRGLDLSRPRNNDMAVVNFVCPARKSIDDFLVCFARTTQEQSRRNEWGGSPNELQRSFLPAYCAWGQDWQAMRFTGVRTVSTSMRPKVTKGVNCKF